MDKEEFDKDRVTGAIQWGDACIIRDHIYEHRPKIVLELGSFTGISTLVIIRALQRNGGDFSFSSIDINKPGQIFNFKDIGRKYRNQLVDEDEPVEVLTGDALKHLKTLAPNSVDMVFEDTTHKTAYTTLLIPAIMRVLKPGGVALFHDLQLPTMMKAFVNTGTRQHLKLFPPTWMGALYKD